MPENPPENRDQNALPVDLRARRSAIGTWRSILGTDLSQTVEPPSSPLRIIRCIGPGLIVAGSIVGSGELIATTKTGAEAGFSLLWLIILGCVVKVFAQIEFGRYAIISGKPTLRALDEVPGPRIKGRGNWLVWYWLVMWLASISQLGGIVGGVGQALGNQRAVEPGRSRVQRGRRCGNAGGFRNVSRQGRATRRSGGARRSWWLTKCFRPRSK